MRNIFPIYGTLKSYRSNKLKGDITAGITVGVMLIPQGMAYAMLAGLPPIYGLYASTIPIIIYALFGTSQQLAIGPGAMIALLTLAGVEVLAEVGTMQYISLTITLTLLTGIIHVVLGFLRFGFIVNFISYPVIAGFTSAAAVIIFLSQLKNLLGFHIPRGDHTWDTLLYAMQHIDQAHITTMIISLISIVILISLKKSKSIIPGPIVIVTAGIIAVTVWGLNNMGVHIVGQVPEGMPRMIMPEISSHQVIQLAPAALMIALIIFVQSIAVSKAIQAKHKDVDILPNQELIALGTANIVGSFFQSFPVTGGMARTAVNDQAGARSVIASLITAGLIILTLLYLTPIFSNLPNAVLSAIITVAVYGLINHQEARYLWKSHKADFWMMAATFFMTLILGIKEGILVGVVLSVGVMIFKTTRPHIAELAKVQGLNIYRNVDRFNDLINRPDLLIIRWDAQLYFANISYFKDEISSRMNKKGSTLKSIILDMESITDIDSSGLHALEDIIIDIKQRGIQLYFTGVRGPVRDLMTITRLTQQLGLSNFYLSVHHAVEHHDHPETSFEHCQKYTLQTNIKKADNSSTR